MKHGGCMRIKRRIGLNLNSDVSLVRYFEQNCILVKKSGHIGIVEVYEDDPAWPEIRDLLSVLHKRAQSETLFTNEELQSASWLIVRSSWRNGYPQPDGDGLYKTLTYSCDKYCSICGSGLVQNNPFRILKTPNWGRRNFFMLNWIFDELFVDEVTKTLLSNSELTGFSFMEVLNKKGTERISNTYQLVISTVLSEGLIAELPAIDDVYCCEKCGIKKYHPCGRGMKLYKKEVFEKAPDIVKTAEIFGWGQGADRLVVISNKMYRFLVENHLDKCLCFEPIELQL